MSSIVEKLRGVFTARQVKAAETYREFVAQAATVHADKLKPEAVAECLDRSGKSLADFEADVEKVKRRNTARAEIATAQAVADKQERAAADLERIEKAWVQQQEAHQNQIDPLYWTVRQAEQAAGTVINLKAELLSGCQDPDLHAERKALAGESRQIEQQINVARGELDKQSATLRTIETMIEGFKLHTPEASERAEANRRLELWRERVGESTARLRQLNAQRETCAARSLDIDRRMTQSPF